ncbi:Hypothetical_protein [Hexamita inflata]|uniref:Hypothetical_protein n=1 Tax=Hexamita inflata TaxID=28002 RepID=A0AA86UB40_9EUKA|nr:Hypothetical protein HINF_LOCUS23043 [Hexamita inflata]CAI9962209.1 Hypothetical protein HINF_LOCUS49854 [Hexamita inflata]CAI9962210.1 Hypothetical protein HINF_LOCUS49855 [Hexamita inflata]
MQQVSQFAVFGFNTQKQDILDSDIFVTINYSILTGALICMQCDIDVQISQLQFVAHGIQISALILRSISTVQVTKVNISFRFTSNFSSGLINHVNQSIKIFTISQSLLTGFNNLSSVSNGYICSKLSVDIQILVNQFSVCVQNTVKFGSSLFIGTLSQTESQTCGNICNNNQFVTYGLCSHQPQFSTLLQNETVICEYPFVFNAVVNTCECDLGFFLNVTYCVNVIMQFSMVQKNATVLEITLKNEIQKTEIELKTAFISLEQLIMFNITALTQNVNNNDKILNQSIQSMNDTIHKNLNDLRIQNANQISTLTGFIENKHIITVNTLKTKMDENQQNIKNNFSAIANTMATQTYVKAVYDSLLGTLSTQAYLTSVYNNIMAAVSVANPCKSWPGSVNENGLCKCTYQGQSAFCPNFNSCCKFDSSSSSSHASGSSFYHSLQCANGISRQASSQSSGEDSYSRINSICGFAKYYTNL